MKVWSILFVGFVIFLGGCGLNKQSRALRALEKCTYEFESADSVYLAGTDVMKLLRDGQVDVGRLPGVALGFLSRNIPLQAMLNIRVKNPTNQLAGIGAFQYRILIADREVVNGTSNTPMSIAANSTEVIPFRIDANVYGLLSNQDVLREVIGFVQQDQNSPEKIKLTFSVKPTLSLGNQVINYPGFISVDRYVDRSFFVKNGLSR